MAAGLVGIGSTIGLDRLVDSLLTVAMEKTETMSDWRLRPLSRLETILNAVNCRHRVFRSQIIYAMEDVQHLHQMHDILHERIEQSGRATWLAEDMAYALEVRRNARICRMVTSVSAGASGCTRHRAVQKRTALGQNQGYGPVLDHLLR